MKQISPVFAVAALLAVFLTGAGPGFGQEASQSGLTAPERAKLHQLGFAVVPDPVPAGFRIRDVHVDTGGRKYRIEYVRSRDGATMLFEGSARPGDAPKAHHGLFSGLGKAIAGIGHTANTTSSSMRSTSSEQVTPEQEQEMTSVESDSALTGPIHFANDHGCLKGTPDSGKALITNAHFTVQACSMRQPDPLIRAYKSVVRV
jgi:hypothetical protein